MSAIVLGCELLDEWKWSVCICLKFVSSTTHEACTLTASMERNKGVFSSVHLPKWVTKASASHVATCSPVNGIFHGCVEWCLHLDAKIKTMDMYPKNRGSYPSDCSFSGKRPIFKHEILVYSGKRPNNTTALRLGATEWHTGCRGTCPSPHKTQLLECSTKGEEWTCYGPSVSFNIEPLYAAIIHLYLQHFNCNQH